MIKIGLGYKMRQGKDTFARFIKEDFGNKYYIKLYSFAEELKQEINELYEEHGSWTAVFSYIHHHIQELPDWVVIQSGDLLDMTDPLCPYGKQRYLLQWYGSEYRRAQSPNYWVKKLAQRIKQDEDEIQVGIITDVRFPNEIRWIESFGRDGITVKVERTNFEVNQTEHISEKMLDGFEFDYTVKASSLDELRDDALAFFDILIKREEMPDEFRNWDVE